MPSDKMQCADLDMNLAALSGQVAALRAIIPNHIFFTECAVSVVSTDTMLIVIAGITDNLTAELAKALLKAGHTVRGLGRSPEKLPLSVFTQLECTA
jgi:hypothetical protein